MPDNIIVKDALGANQTMRTTDNAGVHTPTHAVDVSFGAGANDAKTQRVTHSSDDPAVTALNSIDADVGLLTATAAPADGTGNYSVISALKRGLLNWSSLLARIPTLFTNTPLHNTGAIPVRLAPQNVDSAGFSAVGTTIDTFFNTPILTGGVTFSQAAGSLAIVTNTTVNAEMLARSVNSYRGSMRLRASLIASQRIVNNNLAIMLADLTGEGLTYNIVNSTTVDVTRSAHGFDATMIGQFVNLAGITGAAGVPGRYAIASIPDVNTIRFTVVAWPATGTGTLTLFGRNYVRNLVTGTTATNINFDAQRNGWATGDTVGTVNTTASPGLVIANELTGRDVFFSDSLRATSLTPDFTTRASRYENIPDQSVELFVFLWNFNGTTAPASNTTWTLSQLVVETFSNTPVYLQGIRAQGNANALPVKFPAAQAVTVSSGTVTTVSTVTALTGGGAAEDAAAGTNPVMVGGVVRTATTPVTLVAGDAARLTMAGSGAAVMKPYAVPEAGWNSSVSLTTTTAAALQAAGGTSLKRHITALQCINVGTVTELIILDGATERWRLTLPLNIPVMIEFPTELLTTANTALNVNLSIASTSVRVNAQGYTSS